MNDAPVFIVDDDEDDQAFIVEAWKELGYTNELLFFQNGEAVLKHLKAEPLVPFLILCDVNIPRMDGFELKDRLLESDALYHKSIPFVFWSGEASSEQIKKAYDLRVNGFFVKDSSIGDLKASLATIVEYWQRSKAPVA
jgi:CheY-like chemotaxis protein